jgi:hypothetical protein
LRPTNINARRIVVEEDIHQSTGDKTARRRTIERGIRYSLRENALEKEDDSKGACRDSEIN